MKLDSAIILDSYWAYNTIGLKTGSNDRFIRVLAWYLYDTVFVSFGHYTSIQGTAMNRMTKMNALLFFLALSLVGCSFRGSIVAGPSDLPEDIHIAPQLKRYYPYNVGIFQFSGPSNAPATGKLAAYYLYTKLSEQKAFSSITFEENASVDPDSIVATMKAKRYDMAIVGKLVQYVEGGYFQSSHVEEHVWAIRRMGKKTEILLYAKAFETFPPVSAADYIIFTREGTPAPSASKLLKKNATKFENLLVAAFSQNK